MSRRPIDVAVVGATGAVGREMLRVLEQRGSPVQRLVLLASSRSAGRTLRFRGRDLTVRPTTRDSFRGVDVALFSAGVAVSRQFAACAVESGAVVVDNSSAFRLQPGVPLVVPECNTEALAGHRGIVANPNCSTIILALALAPLQRIAGLKQVIVSTYQAASGAGRRAMEELRSATRAHLSGAGFEPSAMPHDLAFNVFPQVDVFQPDGYTREEDKMVDEMRKILALPALPLEATCVRVPVERCHGMAVTVALQRPLSPARARFALEHSPGIVVCDDPEAAEYPTPRAMAGLDPVAVGRIRPSRVFDPGLTLWVVGDQLRKGAALNAVQIVENLSNLRTRSGARVEDSVRPGAE